MIMKKTDKFLLIFFIILVILTIVALLNQDIADQFDISSWFASKSYAEINYFYALGFIVVVSFLGALVPIPIPYIIPAGNFALAWYEFSPNPIPKIIVMIFFAALGNSIGDLVDYLIGSGANAVISSENPEQVSRWSEKVMKNPNSIPWVIFLFALTPLPDSLLLAPLGFIKYPLKKTLMYMYVGKLGMFSIVSVVWILGIKNLIDLLGDQTSSPLIGLSILYFMWAIILTMAKKN